MKNQYFGDVNDYKKYGLLRILSDGGSLRIGLCWMLTDGDRTGHGGLIGYLHQPKQWRHYDPELFDKLGQSVKEECPRGTAPRVNSVCHLLQ